MHNVIFDALPPAPRNLAPGTSMSTQFIAAHSHSFIIHVFNLKKSIHSSPSFTTLGSILCASLRPSLHTQQSHLFTSSVSILEIVLVAFSILVSACSIQDDRHKPGRGSLKEDLS